MYPKVDAVPDKSDMQAFTQFGIGYTGLKHHKRGDRVNVTLVLTVAFIEKDSWVLRAHQGAKLLEHERVHLMIAACGGHKMYKQAIGNTDTSESAANAE